MIKVKFLQSAYVWDLQSAFYVHQEVELEDVNLANMLVEVKVVEIIEEPKNTKLKKGE